MSKRTSSKPLRTQTPLAFDTSAASAAFGSDCWLVRLHATEDCHILFTAAGTASTTSEMFLPGDQTEYFDVMPGQKVTAIKATTAGTLHITEMAQP